MIKIHSKGIEAKPEHAVVYTRLTSQSQKHSDDHGDYGAPSTGGGQYKINTSLMNVCF